MNPRPAILISGASTGIGRETTLHLASRGFRVFAGVRREGDGGSLAGCGRVEPILLDVTDQGSIARAVETVAHVVGAEGLHGLVNNAGIAVVGPVETLPLAEWRRQFEVNLFGAIALTQAALPLLRQHVAMKGPGAARIVQMSSISAHFGHPILAPYSASKAALRSMTEAMRVELRRQGILVSMLEPGPVKSEIWSKGRSWKDEASNASPSARALYGPEIDAAMRIAQEAEEKAIDAIEIAKLVEDALTHRRPYLRRVVTGGARVATVVRSLVSERVWDALVWKSLRIR